MIALPKFKISKVTLFPSNPKAAKELLIDLGLSEWFAFSTMSRGAVGGAPASNLRTSEYSAGDMNVGTNIEILQYNSGNNWAERNPNQVAALGMVVNAEELSRIRAYFNYKNVPIAQDMTEISNTWEDRCPQCQSIVFSTRHILGVDLEFTVVLREPELDGANESEPQAEVKPAPKRGRKSVPVTKEKTVKPRR